MKAADAGAWSAALSRYQYPVDLGAFGRQFGPDWFHMNLHPGTVEQTTMLETRFRERASDSLEAWYEVIFWKMFSQRGRAQFLTARIVDRIVAREITASQLRVALSSFVIEESRERFASLRSLFFDSPVMPVVATFPAFADPDRFPMVDSRVAKWVNLYLRKYQTPTNAAASLVPYTARSTTLTTTTAGWNFYRQWTKWCRSTADILSTCTPQVWRARDVEMAAFQNYGELPNFPLLPQITLDTKPHRS